MKSQKIVLGVVKNEAGQYLVSQRPDGIHFAGFWEFPGGKVEHGESFKRALRRELSEEVGILVRCNYKLIEFKHQYDDRILHFQVYIVNSNNAQAVSNEKQKLKWIDKQILSELQFPPANQPILDALSLPKAFIIADYSVLGEDLIRVVRMQLSKGISLVQFRAPTLKKKHYVSLANKLVQLCKEQNAKLIVNCERDWNNEINANGVHLNSERLKRAYNSINRDDDINIFSASCHTEQEINYANELKVKTVLIGAVQNSQSHPNNKPLGWARFSQLCLMANMPVYAIGGVGVNDIPIALVHGAQGIAGIRAFIER